MHFSFWGWETKIFWRDSFSKVINKTFMILLLGRCALMDLLWTTGLELVASSQGRLGRWASLRALCLLSHVWPAHQTRQGARIMSKFTLLRIPRDGYYKNFKNRILKFKDVFLDVALPFPPAPINVHTRIKANSMVQGPLAWWPTYSGLQFQFCYSPGPGPNVGFLGVSLLCGGRLEGWMLGPKYPMC